MLTIVYIVLPILLAADFLYYIQSDVSETVQIIWSYHPSDPSNSTGDFPQHTNQGSRSLNLIGRLETERSVPSDAAIFTIRNNNASHAL